MRRARLWLVAALLLSMCVAGAAVADNYVVNGDFSNGLTGWQPWYSDLGNYTSVQPGTTPLTSVVVDYAYNDHLNPALSVFRWDSNGSKAIGVAQYVGAYNLAGVAHVSLKADVTLLAQSWGDNTSASMMFPAMMGVGYRGADQVDHVLMKYFYISGTSSALYSEMLSPNITHTVDWDLRPLLGQDAVITGVILGGQGDRFAAQFDNVQLSGIPAPEPAGSLALATALCSLVPLARRRRSH